MPPYIEGKTDPPRLFYCDGDGNYVPFTKIEDITFRKELEDNPDSITPSWTETGELCFTATFTPRTSRRFWRMVHAWNNHMCRERRTAKRQKEKERKRKLKGGDRMCQKHGN